MHPTPIYELIVALLIAWILWRRGSPERPRPIGQLTGEYLVLSGLARFLVEFIRINPRIYWGMSNAQVASIGSIVAGIALIAWARRRYISGSESPAPAAGGFTLEPRLQRLQIRLRLLQFRKQPLLSLKLA